MRLRFSPGGDDEGAYRAARDVLLDEFDAWLDGLGEPESERVEIVCDTGIFLDWRYGYSTGVLDELSDDDVAEFLIGWCPRKLAVPADEADGVCRAVGAFVEFMAATGRLVGGGERAAVLRALADDLVPMMRSEMADPANFGMGKTLTEGLGDLSAMSEDEVLSALQARMDEIDALPFAERKALTDPLIEPAAEEPYELPFLYIPPPMADVRAAAAAAPLPARVAALREYLGPDGKPLTEKGNLKLADGRALAELLDTGDEIDQQIGDRTFKTRSSAELHRLMFLIEVAREAGAVRVYRRRLMPVRAWTARPPVQQALALVASIFELGPLQSLSSRCVAFFDHLHRLLDDGIVLWLSPLLGPRVEMSFEDLVELPKLIAAQQLSRYWPEYLTDSRDDFTVQDMSRIFEVLELAGVLRWTDRIDVDRGYGFCYSTGGTVGLTALGRHVLPDYLDDAGLVLRSVGDLADADGAGLIEAMLAVPDTQHESLVAAWQPDRPAIERVQLLTGAIVSSASAKGRLMGFVALDVFDVGVVEPLVRQLLDTPVGGSAAMWLMAHDLADSASLGSFVDTAALIDVFATVLDEPEELCDLFTAGPDAGQPFRLLEGMWRHPAPETAPILDTLGRHLTDPKLAKAARKAAMRHRSWMANRG